MGQKARSAIPLQPQPSSLRMPWRDRHAPAFGDKRDRALISHLSAAPLNPPRRQARSQSRLRLTRPPIQSLAHHRQALRCLQSILVHHSCTEQYAKRTFLSGRNGHCHLGFTRLLKRRIWMYGVSSCRRMEKARLVGPGQAFRASTEPLGNPEILVQEGTVDKSQEFQTQSRRSSPLLPEPVGPGSTGSYPAHVARPGDDRRKNHRGGVFSWHV